MLTRCFRMPFPKEEASANTSKTLMDATVLAKSMETLLRNLRDKKESAKSMKIERRDLEQIAARQRICFFPPL